MQLSDFHYDLPESLIAQYPVQQRSHSRLLLLDSDSGALSDHHFNELPKFLNPGDLLVFNNTRVIPARLFARKASGGKIEVLIERIVSETELVAQIRASKAPKAGTQILVNDQIVFDVQEKDGGFYRLHYLGQNLGQNSLGEFLEQYGQLPLPPYIKRQPEQQDREHYQTVFAEKDGAVAAPTAGLHFDQPLLQVLSDKGVEFAYVTLHVGAGTFQPVRVADIREHRMHKEYVEVSEQVCAQIAATQKAGGRVIAVGTTSIRCLETAALSGQLQPFYGDTDIFIYPGKPIRVADALITNFHLPESTLLMLVSAFAGTQNIQRAYAHAIAREYRFFSYGDAMLMTRLKG